MKLTRMLTKKLTTFWLVSIASVAFVFIVTAAMSFIQQTSQFQQNKVAEFEKILVEHIEQHGGTQLNAWVPPILKAYRAVNFELTQQGQVIYRYPDEPAKSKSGFYRYQHQIDQRLDLAITLDLPPAFKLHHFGLYELLILAIGIIATGIFVFFSLRWMSNELNGIEQLAQQSTLVLANDFESARSFNKFGRPRIISRALNRLMNELEDARQERGRLDQFIRTNTFLDPITQIGNKLYFENRIDALSPDNKMLGYGVLFLIQFDEDDSQEEKVLIEPSLHLINQAVQAIRPLITDYEDLVFAKRSHTQLGLIVPQLSLAEADVLANRLLKSCSLLTSNLVTDSDNFVHIGAAFYKANDLKHQLVEEAEMALRAAQLQRVNTWFMYDKGAVDQEFAKGSVRWRSFLEYALVKKRFFTYTQPVIDSDNKVLFCEVFSRVRDNQDTEIRATLFIPMAIKCGLMPQIERQVLEEVLFDLLPNNNHVFTVNLSFDSLTSRAFTRWLQTTSLEYRPYMQRLIFEVSEAILIKHQSNTELHKTLNMITKMGAKLSVDHVGKQVVGSQYIQSFGVDYVKLDPSIIKQVHERPENQLYIRSLIGGILRSNAQVIAEGVDKLEEWQTLKILGVSAAQGSFFMSVK